MILFVSLFLSSFSFSSSSSSFSPILISYRPTIDLVVWGQRWTSVCFLFLLFERKTGWKENHQHQYITHTHKKVRRRRRRRRRGKWCWCSLVSDIHNFPFLVLQQHITLKRLGKEEEEDEAEDVCLTICQRYKRSVAYRPPINTQQETKLLKKKIQFNHYS